MKTKFTNTILLLAVLAMQPAAGQIETLINAVELSPSNIILPQSENGMMTFRPCAGECEREYERVQMTPGAKFSINGKGVKWETFKKEFPALRSRDGAYALVSYDTKNRMLVSLEIKV